MKLRLLTDLHLEGAFFAYEDMGEDVLLLLGDITTAKRHSIFEALIEAVPNHIEIFFLAGNHEFYDGIFELENQYYEGLMLKYDNFTFFNNTAFTYKDVEFFGGTMFTDFKLDGEQQAWFAKHAAKDMIADFHYIKTLGGHFEPVRWTTADHITQHEIFVNNFEAWLKNTEGKQRIVLTHFMPAPQCTAERFKGSTTNPYFTADMTKYFGLMTHWFAGHGHNSIDTIINDTRLVMNPRGYGTENRNNFNPNMIIEV